MPRHILIAILIPLAMSACSVTGPADDRYYQDEGDNGRLFSDEQRTIFSSDKKQVSSPVAEPNTKESVIGTGLDSNKEFELYKQWKAMRSNSELSEEYKEFLLWLEFRKMKQQ